MRPQARVPAIFALAAFLLMSTTALADEEVPAEPHEQTDEQADDATETDGPVIDLPDRYDPSATSDGQATGSTTRTTIGGYGEFEYTDVEGPGGRSFDFHRFVLFFGHHFNDQIRFHSDVEIEHAEVVEMEQAFIGYEVIDGLEVRAGLQLVPVGLTNLLHEPSLYHGAIRPRVDKVIIPTTWRELAGGLYWSPNDWLTVEGYIMSSLAATGFSDSSGIRSGRQAVSKALGNDIAFAARASVEPVLGLTLALSGYLGWADQGEIGESVQVSIVEADVRYVGHGIEARAELASISVGESEAVSAAVGDTVGSQMFGWFVEAGYDVLDSLDCTHAIIPFARFEQYNTHASVEGALTANDDFDRSDLTFGLTYRPIRTVSLKFDYTLADSAGEDIDDQWDLGLGWMF